MHIKGKSHAKIKALSERGDTIVEVVIVLAVLAFAISLSYASAARSLSDAQQSEENSYAAELAQNQVEEIRTMVNTSTEDATGKISGMSAVLPQDGSQFCMSGGKAISFVTANCQPSPAPSGGFNYTWSDTLTQTANVGNPSQPFTNTFEVEVYWPDVMGQGQDTVTLFYRAYPPL